MSACPPFHFRALRSGGSRPVATAPRETTGAASPNVPRRTAALQMPPLFTLKSSVEIFVEPQRSQRSQRNEGWIGRISAFRKKPDFHHLGESVFCRNRARLRSKSRYFLRRSLRSQRLCVRTQTRNLGSQLAILSALGVGEAWRRVPDTPSPKLRDSPWRKPMRVLLQRTRRGASLPIQATRTLPLPFSAGRFAPAGRRGS